MWPYVKYIVFGDLRDIMGALCVTSYDFKCKISCGIFYLSNTGDKLVPYVDTLSLEKDNSLQPLLSPAVS